MINYIESILDSGSMLFVGQTVQKTWSAGICFVSLENVWCLPKDSLRHAGEKFVAAFDCRDT